MQPQTRTRTMRRPGRHHGRKTDGTRKVYYPAARAAKSVRVTVTTEQEKS